MKNLISSVGFQDEAGNLLGNGSIILTLPPGMYLIASGGGQVVGQSVIFNLNNLAKLSGTVSIWASDELSPQTAFNVTLCAQANGLQPVGYATWFIGGVSPIDLSLMTPSVTGPSYSGAVVLAPNAQQTINGQTLALEGASVGFSASGSTVPDSFFSRLAAGVIGVGTGIANALGTLRAAILQIGGADTGLSRSAAGTVAVGNGAQGDATGTLVTTLLKAPSANPVVINGGSGSATDLVVNNAASTANLFIVNDTGLVQIAKAGAAVQFFGSTSGTTNLQASAVAGATALTLPAATDQLIGRATTDTLTGKSFDTAGAGNVFKINGTAITAVTGSGSVVLATSPTIATPTLTSPTITSPTINTGVSQGSGVKHQRFGAACTTPASSGSTCTTTYSWTSAFADANYTPVCVADGPSNGTAIWSLQGFTASGVTIILTSQGLASTYGGVRCYGVHD